MNQNLLTSMQQILSQKGLPKEILVEAIEAALLQAAKRRFGSVQAVNVRLDETSGDIHVTAPKRVVEIMRSFATEIPIEEAVKIKPDVRVGDTIEVPVETKDFGRIEAQLARQILVQKIKDAERANIFNLYKERIEDIVTGVVQQEDRRDVIVEIENTEAILPVSEQLRNERYRRGDRIRALIIDVADPEDPDRQGRRGRAPVVLSRAHPVLLVRLFEQEVPEIVDGLVRIEAVAREPGERAKIAVSSLEEGIDPVGTCVGVRGSRVLMVMQELNGERVDVIPWSADAHQFIAKALSPAKVSEVILEEDEDGDPVATVIVPDDQLSLAIGRRGQNARLASRLTDWRIDIVGEQEAGAALRSQVMSEIFKEAGEDEQADESTEEQGAAAPVDTVVGVSPRIADALREHGCETVGDLADADPEELAKLPNVGVKTSEKLVRSAQDVIDAHEKAAGRPTESAEPPSDHEPEAEAEPEPEPVEETETADAQDETDHEPEPVEETETADAQDETDHE